jgi:hypothetical protein
MEYVYMPSRILSYILRDGKEGYLAYIVVDDKETVGKLAALLHLAVV